tara:strand:+ start:2535 stop:2903 length:369 start_codon:yes stop_codon:yes gene_type:complete
MKSKSGYKDKIISLYSEAQFLAKKLNIDLKEIYEKQVQVREEFGDKVYFDDIDNADSFGAFNGFSGILNELKSIEMIFSFDGSSKYENLQPIDKELYDSSILLICSWFEHISKWINIENNNK